MATMMEAEEDASAKIKRLKGADVSGDSESEDDHLLSAVFQDSSSSHNDTNSSGSDDTSVADFQIIEGLENSASGEEEKETAKVIRVQCDACLGVLIDGEECQFCPSCNSTFHFRCAELTINWLCPSCKLHVRETLSAVLRNVCRTENSTPKPAVALRPLSSALVSDWDEKSPGLGQLVSQFVGSVKGSSLLRCRQCKQRFSYSVSLRTLVVHLVQRCDLCLVDSEAERNTFSQEDVPRLIRHFTAYLAHFPPLVVGEQGEMGQATARYDAHVANRLAVSVRSLFEDLGIEMSEEHKSATKAFCSELHRLIDENPGLDSRLTVEDLAVEEKRVMKGEHMNI